MYRTMTPNRDFRFALGTLLAVTMAALAGCDSDHTESTSQRLQGQVSIDGSSTVYPITEAVSEEFGAQHGRSVRVTVGISGTGGGFKRFSIGETDISNASRPIKKEERDNATQHGVQFVELPIAYDGLSIVINQGNTWAGDLTVDELKKIFLDGSPVKTWNDIRPDWPDVPIKLFSPGTDSGTFDYFKEVVAGKDDAIRSDMSVSEDDNVLVRGVEGDKGALGFFGCAYYFENKDKLKVLGIDGGQGVVHPTIQTIKDGSYAPFSRPLFIYVNLNSLSRPEVKAFVSFYLDHAPELAEEVGYVRLPKELYDAARQRVDAGSTGTSFLDDHGEKVSGPLSQVYH